MRLITLDFLTNPSDTPSVQSVLCVGAMGSGAVPISLSKIQIFKPTPFGSPTAQIESPRRALAIRAAEGEIAEGLQQNDAKVTADQV